MIIRKLVTADIPALARLYKQFRDEDSCIEAMYDQFNHIGESDAYDILSAVENGQLIGSVMGVVCRELYRNCQPFMVMENMIVDSAHRNKGVGKALIAAIEKIAVAKNCTQIILVTDAGRFDACKLYESAGYSPLTHKGFKKKLQ